MINFNTSVNGTRILNLLWQESGLSRVDISKRLDINKATVTLIINEFIASGVVKEGNIGNSSKLGGRKPVALELNTKFGTIIGLEIHPNYIQAIGVDISGSIIFSKKSIFKILDQNSLIDSVTSFLDELISTEVVGSLLGVSCGIPGIIDSSAGIILESYPLNITKPFKFKELLMQKYNVPVLIENDARCCCWGELNSKREESMSDFLFILGESKNENSIVSVGLGVVINGQVHHGHQYSAGEFKSINWKPGNKSQFNIDNDDLINLEFGSETYYKVIEDLADNISILTNVLNLEHVVLGGFLQESKDKRVVDIIKNRIQSNWGYSGGVSCNILFSSYHEYLISFGATCYFLEYTFGLEAIRKMLGV